MAQPPEATFVTRLRPAQLPGQVARQLPDPSTTLRVEPSSTSDSRLRGARPRADIRIAEPNAVWMATTCSPILCLFSEGSTNGKKQRSTLRNWDRMIFSAAAMSMKSGLLETLQHMVVHCLGAELRGELLSV